MNSMILFLVAITTIGAGLMAGVYFAFSTFIMRSLNQLQETESIAAMNAINNCILKSWFMPLFFGTSLLSLLLAAVMLFNWDAPKAPAILMASLIYFIGMFLCTALFNVPLNNRLAASKDSDTGKVLNWMDYYQSWTRWNHLRAICSVVTCAMGILVLAT